jgi:hypothetical protein
MDMITLSRSEKMMLPRISVIEILLWGVALFAFISGAFCLVLSYSSKSTTELAIGVPSLFMSFQFFALSHGLRWLQLIEWRLALRNDSPAIRSRLDSA